jgi:hypothetical protein
MNIDETNWAIQKQDLDDRLQRFNNTCDIGILFAYINKAIDKFYLDNLVDDIKKMSYSDYWELYKDAQKLSNFPPGLI